MPAAENKAIFLRFVDEIGRGNLGIVDEICSPDFAFYSPNSPDWPRGLEGARQLVGRGISGGVQSTIEDIIAEGDKIAIRWTFRGIYQGTARPGYPEPGESYTFGSMSIYRFADGKIAEDWGVDVLWPSGKQAAVNRGWVNVNSSSASLVRPSTDPSISAEENKALFLNFVNELRKGNVGIVNQVSSPDFAFYSPNYPDWPRGFNGARQLATYAASIYGDTKDSIEDIIAEGDKLAVRWSFSGTYHGNARPGYPIPGEPASIGLMSMYRFANGKIEENWGVEAFWPMDNQGAANRGWIKK